MADFSGSASVLPLHISTFDILYGATGTARGTGNQSGANLTWVTNLAVYVPVQFPFAYPVRRVFWTNGNTIATSNAAFGIYSARGTKMYASASTALSGANTTQYVTPATDILLPAGQYYLAYICDNTTARGFGMSSPSIAAMRASGLLQEAVGSMTLPATMTPAAMANQLFPLIGVTRTSSGY